VTKPPGEKDRRGRRLHRSRNQLQKWNRRRSNLSRSVSKRLAARGSASFHPPRAGDSIGSTLASFIGRAVYPNPFRPLAKPKFTTNAGVTKFPQGKNSFKRCRHRIANRQAEAKDDA
jgi:hypothetical protein